MGVSVVGEEGGISTEGHDKTPVGKQLRVAFSGLKEASLGSEARPDLPATTAGQRRRPLRHSAALGPH